MIRTGERLPMAAVATAGVVLALAGGARAGIPFRTAEVESADGRSFTLHWDAPGVRTVRVFASRTPGGAGEVKATGAGVGDARVTLPAAARWYFRLAPDRGEALTVADRSLHIPSVSNLRDIGGYRTADGRWVKVGLAYRANALSDLTDADLREVDALKLKVVCDLRTDAERRRSPDRAIPGAQPIVDDVMASRSAAAPASPPPAPLTGAQRLQQANRDFVDLPSAQAAYHDLLERMSHAENLPTLFHCTAGKDRTGWGQAVLLTILGVPRDVILRDYLLTNTYLAPQLPALNAQLHLSEVDAKAVMAADRSYLEAAFAEVDVRFGSMDRYLRDGLHLDDATLARLRATFLTGAPPPRMQRASAD